MVVTDYHKKGTIGDIQKEGTMNVPTRWLCCTSKRSCESRSCDRISTYRLRKKEKCGPSAQERNTVSHSVRLYFIFLLTHLSHVEYLVSYCPCPCV